MRRHVCQSVVASSLADILIFSCTPDHWQRRRGNVAGDIVTKPIATNFAVHFEKYSTLTTITGVTE